MAIFNQLTGINAILYYAPKIIGSAGATADDSLWRSIPLGMTLLLFTIVAMFVIDRFGRRILLLIGSVGMTLCLALVSATFANNPDRHEWLILGGLMGSIAFFAMSQGAVMFVFISEIFPNAVRAKGQALGTFIHWSMAAIVTWYFPRCRAFGRRRVRLLCRHDGPAIFFRLENHARNQRRGVGRYRKTDRKRKVAANCR